MLDRNYHVNGQIIHQEESLVGDNQWEESNVVADYSMKLAHNLLSQQQPGLSPFFLFLTAFSGATGIGPMTSSSAGGEDPALIYRFLPSLSLAYSTLKLAHQPVMLQLQALPSTHTSLTKALICTRPLQFQLASYMYVLNLYQQLAQIKIASQITDCSFYQECTPAFILKP